MKYSNLLKNLVIIVIYYLLFYIPFIIQIGQYSYIEFIDKYFFPINYLVIPLLIWLKFTFFSKLSLRQIFYLCALLSAPFAYELGIGLGHAQINTWTIIKNLQFPLVLSPLFGFISMGIKFIYIKLREVW